MTARRCWLFIAVFFFLLAISILPIRAEEDENESDLDSLEVYYFNDVKTFKLKIIEVPSGKVTEEKTEDIEDSIGAIGVAVAKQFPRTWVVLGPITLSTGEPSLTSDMQYYMKYFKLEYLGKAPVKVSETEIYSPEDDNDTDNTEPEAVFGFHPRRMETWGGSDDGDDSGSDGQGGGIDDDSDEPGGPPVQEVEAFIHIYKYNGLR